MADITIIIRTDNEAFTEDAPHEISRILKDVGQRIANVWGSGDNNPQDGAHGFEVRDYNGNRVGVVSITAE